MAEGPYTFLRPHRALSFGPETGDELAFVLRTDAVLPDLYAARSEVFTDRYGGGELLTGSGTLNPIAAGDGTFKVFVDRTSSLDTDANIICATVSSLSPFVIVEPADRDGDGVPDRRACQPDSDLSATVAIDGCDSRVANVLFDDGCTILDLIWSCVDEADNHGQFVSCVARLTEALRRAGTITGREKGRIQRCAARAKLP